ncbi:MAG: nitroreductase family protein [Nitrospirota bacterium]
MELAHAIQGRVSIRRFKQTPISDEDINRILDSARYAPSANNTQPWNFMVIKDRTLLKKMGDAVRTMVDRMVPFAENETQVQRLAAYKNSFYTFFEHAPLVIAVLLESYDAGTDTLLARMGYERDDIKRLRPWPGLQSVSAAIQNMLLTIHSLGYGSCWMTGPLVAQDDFKQILQYGDDRFIVALLPIGIPDEQPLPRTRKPLEALVKIFK